MIRRPTFLIVRNSLVQQSIPANLDSAAGCIIAELVEKQVQPRVQDAGSRGAQDVGGLGRPEDQVASGRVDRIHNAVPEFGAAAQQERHHQRQSENKNGIHPPLQAFAELLHEDTPQHRLEN